jgi:putative transposase
MPQSLADVLIHLVFSTKGRAPFLKTAEVREQLNAYLVGALKDLGCPSLITRSVEDHVHILCQLSRTIAIAQLVKEVKSNSSVWLKDQGPGLRDFHWQAGYGAFSVSHSNKEQGTSESVYCQSGRASPHADVSGRISLVTPAARN